MITIPENLKNTISEYEISYENINESISNPTYSQKLPHNYELLIKKFENQKERRTWLLIGMYKKSELILNFAFWMPHEFAILQDYSVLDKLDLFIFQFGFELYSRNMSQSNNISSKVKLVREFKIISNNPISDPEYYFGHKMIDGAVCLKRKLVTPSRQDNKYVLDIHFYFLFNVYKYLHWVHSIPFVKIKLKPEMFFFELDDIIDILEPNGKTQIELYEIPNSTEVNITHNERMEIEVPKLYKDKMKYIFDRMNNSTVGSLGFDISYSFGKKCIFCPDKKEINLSKEHIFPVWLREFIPSATLKTFIRLENPYTKSKTPFKAGNVFLHGYTVKQVCVECNNNWMSQLEVNVKPIITDNNSLKSNFQIFSEHESNTLSRWLVLKSLLILHKSFNRARFFINDIFTSLKNGNIDSNFQVEYYHLDGHDFNFLVTFGTLVRNELYFLNTLNITDARKSSKELFICCIKFGNLAFRISYLDSKSNLIRKSSLLNTTIIFPYGTEMEKVADQLVYERFNEDISKLDDFVKLTNYSLIISE